MHQHPIVGYIIGMIIRNLEVIDLDGAFEQLVLDFFDDDIFAVDQDKNVPRAEVRCIRPALDRTIERVRRRGNDFLAAHENVRQLGRVFERGINNLFQSSHLIPYNTVRKDMPPKGRNKHPLGIWYIFGTERTRSIELLDFADFASVNILKNILNAVRNFRSADVLHW